MAVLAALYLALAVIAMKFGVAGGNATVLWPSSGLALFAVLMYGYRIWPGIFIGACAASLWIDNPVWVSLPIAAGNTLDAVAGAWLLRKCVFDPALARLADYYRLGLYGGMAASLFSTLLGPFSLWLTGLFPLAQLPIVMLHWWMGSVLGVVLFTPMLLVWRDTPRRLLLDPRRLAEGALLLALFLYFGGIVFLGWEFVIELQPYAMAFWVIPFFVWVGLRFGRHGMVVLLLLQFALSLMGASRGSGLFGTDLYDTGLLNFWFYHMVFNIAGMTVSLVLRERHDTMLALRRTAQVFEHSNQGIMITDAAHRIISVNRAFTRITGYAEADAIGRDPHMLSSGTHSKEFYAKVWASVDATGAWSGEIWNRRKDGGLYVEWLDICTVKSPSTGLTENYIGLFMDITDRKADEQNILHQAQHDFLTGLPNRLLFTDRFNQALATSRRQQSRFAVLFLDMDGFKQVNDSHGHHVGDILLKQIALRLTATLRATDTVCRLGGDEFVILVPELEDVENLEVLSDKLLKVLEEPYRVEDYEIHSMASIGYAIYPDHGVDLDALLAAADRAMYQAKQAGGNRCYAAAPRRMRVRAGAR